MDLRHEMGWVEDKGERFVAEENSVATEESFETVRTPEEDTIDTHKDVNSECDDLSFGCPRCTKQHPGLPDECRSCDKVCRKCGVVGHFQEVHDVTDRVFREIIGKTIGLQLWN